MNVMATICHRVILFGRVNGRTPTPFYHLNNRHVILFNEARTHARSFETRDNPPPRTPTHSFVFEIEHENDDNVEVKDTLRLLVCVYVDISDASGLR